MKVSILIFAFVVGSISAIPVSFDDARSNEIGTPCSSDTTQAWLDVVFVVDTSSAMSSRDLIELGGEIATFMRTFNFGQTGDHTTRAAIITYSTIAITRYNLTDTTDFGGFEQAIFKLSTYANSDDNGGNVQGALQMAQSLIESQKSKRKPAIILIAAAYDETGFQGASQTAKTIKDDGISILTISFAAADGVLTNQLQNISSQGYSYVSNQDGLYLSLPYALTQINCFCPTSTLQFRNYNPMSRNYTSFADCLFGFDGDTYPSIATQLCTPGVLASITSQAKLDFISDNIVPHDLKGKKNFTLGLHLVKTQWQWWGYNSSEYLLGAFPVLRQNPAPGDSYGFMWNYQGFNWKLMTGGDNPLPYLCQSRACDASYVC